jgi:hypothetical protein
MPKGIAGPDDSVNKGKIHPLSLYHSDIITYAERPVLVYPSTQHSGILSAVLKVYLITNNAVNYN